MIMVRAGCGVVEDRSRGEGGLDGRAVASHAVGQSPEFALANEADVGDPDIEGHTMINLSANHGSIESQGRPISDASRKVRR
ncbi:hypothetical protein ABZ484_28625 [Streptomyces sp. NPDC006393]|uniref:hypothetical protein n=1 Tax=Streptomyces sp. NPDC006393 TaxID=3156763 RepID=UPI0033FF468C